MRIVAEADDGPFATGDVRLLLVIGDAVIVTRALGHHHAVAERLRVLGHFAQLGEDGHVRLQAEQSVDAASHHEDRRLGGVREVASVEQRREIKDRRSREHACDRTQRIDAQSVGRRRADHLHALLVLRPVAERDGVRLVVLPPRSHHSAH